MSDCIVSVCHERNVRLCYWVVCCGNCVSGLSGAAHFGGHMSKDCLTLTAQRHMLGCWSGRHDHINVSRTAAALWIASSSYTYILVYIYTLYILYMCVHLLETKSLPKIRSCRILLQNICNDCAWLCIIRGNPGDLRHSQQLAEPVHCTWLSLLSSRDPRRTVTQLTTSMA